jgi:hypothetical protein
MKNQTEECQQFNAETAYITPDFNCANLNFYNFDSWTPQHSDDEQIFQSQDVSPAGELSIISISIGAPKKIAVRNKTTNEEIHITLENGDILFMEGTTQQYTTHQVFSNPTDPTELPHLYGYPTLEEFGQYGGRRLNITGRYIHTHSEECPMSAQNLLPMEWAKRSREEQAEEQASYYMPKQCPTQASPTPAPVSPATDPAVSTPVPEVGSSEI